MFKTLKTAFFAFLLLLLGASQACACAMPPSVPQDDAVTLDSHVHAMAQDMECLDELSDECLTSSMTALPHGSDIDAMTVGLDKSKLTTRIKKFTPYFEEKQRLTHRRPAASPPFVVLSPVQLKTRLLN